MGTRNIGPCECCGGDTANCVDEECCSNGTWPATIAVSFPGCNAECYCPEGQFRDSITLNKTLEDSCSVVYNFDEDTCGEGPGVTAFGFTADHNCETGITQVCLSQIAGTASLCWADEFSDPDGSIFCGKAFEIPYDPICTVGSVYCGSPPNPFDCECGAATVG